MSQERNRRGRPKGTGIDDHGHLQRIAAILASDPNLKPTTAIKSLGVTDPSIIRRLRDKFHEARHELQAEVSGQAPEAPRPTSASTNAVAASMGRAAPVGRPVSSEPTAIRAMPARIGEPVRKGASPATLAPAALPPKSVSTAGKTKTAVPAATVGAASDPEAPVQAAAKLAAPAVACAVEAAPVAPSRPEPAKPASTAAAKTTTKTPASEAPAASLTSPAVTATQTNVDPASWLFAMCGFGILAASTALEAQVAWAQSIVRLPPMAMALRQHIALNELAMTLVTPSATTRASFH